MPDSPQLSVVIAGLNEVEGLERAVRAHGDALAELDGGFEIIVVNDASTDGMGVLADELARALPFVRVLHNESNVNYGRSLIRGIAAARGRWILHNPVDLPLAPSDVSLFVPHFDRHDVLVAQRLDRSANSAWRKLTSIGNRTILGLLYRPGTPDLTFVQFYRRDWAQSIELVTTSPATVAPELILRAEKTGRPVLSVPCEFRRRETGRPHFGRAKDIAWTLRDLVRLRLHTWRRGWS